MASVPILQHAALISPQVILLQEMARRGGRMTWRWDNPQVPPFAYDMTADLMHKQLVRFIEVRTDARIVGTTWLELTDAGRSAVAQIEDAAKRRVEVDAAQAVVPVPQTGNPS